MSAYVRFGNALAWHALELARGLHSAGHEVLLLCSKGAPLATWSAGSPFAVHREFDPAASNLAGYFTGWQSMRRAVREFRPDVLNPHCPPGHTHLAVLRGLDHLHAVLIRTVADPRRPSPNPLNRILHERYTDGMLFTTASSVRRYEPFMNLSRVKHEVVLPGFRADDFVRGVQPGGFRQRFGLKPEQVLLGIIARMSPEKGQEVLLAAISSLPDADRARLFCVMAGEDSRERGQADLKAMAREFGVESQTAFLSKRDDVRPLMSELDIGVITSTRSEAICRVALEYMSFGIPVVASDVNILAEVVRSGENGLTFPNHDAKSLATHLRVLLDDRDYRVKLGRGGSGMVRETFNLSTETDQYLTFYHAILTMRGRRRS